MTPKTDVRKCDIRSSTGFNSRKTREIKFFAVSHKPDGRIDLSVLAERAANADAQLVRVSTGLKAFDRFTIDMSEADARRLYEILHRKFQGGELLREAVHGLAQGVGSSLLEALHRSTAVPKALPGTETP